MSKGHVKPRRPYRQYRADPESPPMENLAAAIVYQAVQDAQALVQGNEFKAKNNAGLVTKWELINFFRSKWCATLLGCTELNGEEIIERTGIYDFVERGPHHREHGAHRLRTLDE